VSSRLTLGQRANIPLAAVAALATGFHGGGVGVDVSDALARGPENTMKSSWEIIADFIRGSSGCEGAGAVWPGGDAAMLGW